MDYEKLLESLGIENASEFEYFENFADLCENGEEVEEEALTSFLKEQILMLFWK